VALPGLAMIEARKSHVLLSQMSSQPKLQSDNARTAPDIPMIRPWMDFFPKIDRHAMSLIIS
jgi:hypothetical protein